MSMVAEGRMHQLFINQERSERDGTDSMSSGSMSPDLGEMWSQGYHVGPQWEGELELNSASDYDYDNVNEEDDSFVARDHATESGPKDYVSAVRESSLWILMRDSLSPPDVLVLRTAGRMWNNAKLYGEFVALWFFFSNKN